MIPDNSKKRLEQLRQEMAFRAQLQQQYDKEMSGKYTRDMPSFQEWLDKRPKMAEGGSTDDYFSVLEDRDMSNPRYREYLAKQQGLEGSYPETFVAPLARGLGSLAKTAKDIFAPTKEVGQLINQPIGWRIRVPTKRRLDEPYSYTLPPPATYVPRTPEEIAKQSLKKLPEKFTDAVIENAPKNAAISANDLIELARVYKDNKQPQGKAQGGKVQAKRLYHGTNKDFKSFNVGSYLTDDPDYASKHGNIVMPVHMTASKIKTIPDEDFRLMASKPSALKPYIDEGYHALSSDAHGDYIVLDPSKVKSAITHKAEGGKVEPTQDEMRLALSKAKRHGMYSPLEKLAIDIPRNKGTGAEFMAEISKQKGFKPEEVADRKIPIPEGKMTKLEFLQHLRKHSLPPLQEFEMPDMGSGTEARDDRANDYYGDDFENLSPEQQIDVRDWVRKHNAKYSQYQLPGGENYREMLLKLPALSIEDERRINSLQIDKKRTDPTEWANSENAKKLDALMEKAKKFDEPYKSGHWRMHPNVLAHVRLSDREGPEGEKLLHVEELQSDWHQQGRKHGYVRPREEVAQEMRKEHERLLQEHETKLKEKRNALFNEFKSIKNQLRSMPIGASDLATQLRARELDIAKEFKALDELQPPEMPRIRNDGVPNAPFKKSWHELGMKHVLHHAAKHGYHGVVITPGDEQAERWGDEGLKVHYDKKIPEFLNKFGKPHGVQVGVHPIEVQGKELPPLDVVRRVEEAGLPMNEYLAMLPHERAKYDYATKTIPLHHFPITEPMRTSILKEGMPQYLRGGVVHKAEGGAVLPIEQIKAQMMKKFNGLSTLQSVGAEEAPSLGVKAYVPTVGRPDNGQMPVGGIDTQQGDLPVGGIDMNTLQQGQQLMPNAPPTPAGTQQGMDQVPRGDKIPTMDGTGMPPNPNANPNQMGSNILSMTPQGQAMAAMKPQGLKKGGNVSIDQMKDELANRQRPLCMTHDHGYADGGSVFEEAEKPKKTVKAYKLFRTDKKHPGKLFPLFVDANKPVETGKWLAAKEGEMRGNKVKSKIGDLAYRPGWHAGDLPVATHIGEKSHPSLKAPDTRPENHVWAEVEMPHDVDWQTEANKRGTNAQGKIVPVKAHITDQIPHGGHYRYKTNSNMTGNWLIGGAMKVNRVLSDAEVKKINKEAKTSDLPRAKPLNLAKHGFASGGSLHYEPAKPLSKQEIEAHADRIARQISGEDNPNKKSQRQLDREKTLQVDIKSGGKEIPVPVINYEKIKGANMVGVPGDPSRGGVVPRKRNPTRLGVSMPRAGEYLRGVGGQKLEGNVPMLGGYKYGAYGHPNAWASDLGASAGLYNVVKKLYEENPDADIYGQYHKMTPESLNHAVHTLDAVLSHHQPHNAPPEVIKNLNHLMRNVKTTTSKHDVPYPTFPGFENPNDVMLHGIMNSGMRKKMIGLLSKDKYLSGGKQKMDDLIFALTHPELRNIETGAGGSAIMQFDPTKDLRQSSSPHTTYGYDLPTKLKGRTRYITPFQLLAPRSHANAEREIEAMGKKGTVVPFNQAKMNIIREPIDEQYINQLGEYEMAMKKRLGYKSGGKVKLHSDQDTMQLALTKKSKKAK